MSLHSLSNQIEACSRELEHQRISAFVLLAQQKSYALHQVKKVPLPLAMAIATATGFIAQRFFNSPAPETLWRIYLGYRAF